MHFSRIAIITALVALAAAAPLHSSGNGDFLALDRRYIVSNGNSNNIGTGEEEGKKITSGGKTPDYDMDTGKIIATDDELPHEIKTEPPEIPPEKPTLIPEPLPPTPKTPELPAGITKDVQSQVETLSSKFPLFRANHQIIQGFKGEIYKIIVSCSKLA